jgi:5-methylcytosine-specific restriction enzyme subunit McrC
VLFDMAAVFEDFVVVALREAMGLDERDLVQGAAGRPLTLDHERALCLRPDLSWWRDDRCVLVGDCKYKRPAGESALSHDVYQLLAYTVAVDVPEGVLVYAEPGERTGTHTVRHAGKALHRVGLDLTGPPSAVLAEVADLASRMRRMASRASTRTRI